MGRKKNTGPRGFDESKKGKGKGKNKGGKGNKGKGKGKQDKAHWSELTGKNLLRNVSKQDIVMFYFSFFDFLIFFNFFFAICAVFLSLCEIFTTTKPHKTRKQKKKNSTQIVLTIRMNLILQKKTKMMKKMVTV